MGNVLRGKIGTSAKTREEREMECAGWVRIFYSLSEDERKNWGEGGGEREKYFGWIQLRMFQIVRWPMEF
jgi:hypothetical protein